MRATPLFTKSATYLTLSIFRCDRSFFAGQADTTKAKEKVASLNALREKQRSAGAGASKAGPVVSACVHSLVGTAAIVDFTSLHSSQNFPSLLTIDLSGCDEWASGDGRP